MPRQTMDILQNRPCFPSFDVSPEFRKMPRSEKSHTTYSPLSPISLHPHSSPPSAPKRRHVCSICERAFTTSGHLARHGRVHTGERNHKCPFPGCETRCSRQDNLQQHYRIHLSPGSRRSSARTNAARKRASASSSSTRSTNTESPSPQQKATPPLEQGRYSYHSISAASTPPLGQVSLPPVSALPHSRTAPVTGRLSGTSSPHSSYSSDTHQVLRPLSSPVLSLPVSSSLHYNYRSNDDQTSSNSYSAFVNTPTDLSASQNHAVGGSNFAYANTQATYGAHSRSASPSGVVSSRHSISHINNPQYPSHGQSPSPNSVSSHTSHSGPPTPTYPIPYSHSATAAVHNGQMHTQVNHFQNVYTPNPVVADSPRFLPPLTLAPIPDERYIRRVDLLRPPHNPTPYLHHSQPFSSYSPYHQSIGLGHGWKPEGMRKGLTML